MRFDALLLVLILASGPVAGADDSALNRCAAIENGEERLKCYDALAGDNEPAPKQPERADEPPSPLALRWELQPETKQGTLTFRPHKQNYFLPFRYSTSPNTQPVSPRTGPAPMQDFNNLEAKFQLSFKVKTVEGLFKDRADLWFAFTQQSSWQLYSPDISRPFRETNFEPEIMLVFPTHFRLLGLEGRLVNLGIVHQSNGRSEPLSRSWNRLYAQFGFERGNFALLVRPWYRIPEKSDEDDNRDIDDFLGHGDLQAIYLWKKQTLSLLMRNNLKSPNHGSAQIEWSFPGFRQMRGYAQLFTGYGESMIDYNHRQTTIGIGLILTDVL